MYEDRKIIDAIKARSVADLTTYYETLMAAALTQELLDVLIDLFDLAGRVRGVVGAATYCNILSGKGQKHTKDPLFGLYQSPVFAKKSLMTLCQVPVYYPILRRAAGDSFGPDHCFSVQEPDTALIDGISTWLKSIRTSLPSGASVTKGAYVKPGIDSKAVNRRIKTFLLDQAAGLPAAFPGTELAGATSNRSVYPNYASKSTNALGNTLFTWAYITRSVIPSSGGGDCDQETYRLVFEVRPGGDIQLAGVLRRTVVCKSIPLSASYTMDYAGAREDACPLLRAALEAHWGTASP